jgi:hypothetical protein
MYVIFSYMDLANPDKINAQTQWRIVPFGRRCTLKSSRLLPALPHAHIHVWHMQALTGTHWHTGICKHVYIWAHTHARTHALLPARPPPAPMHACKQCTQSLTLTHTRVNKHAHTIAQLQAQAHMNINLHLHVNTHTHTMAQTCKQARSHATGFN